MGAGGGDGFIYGRYDIFPMPLAYLMSWQFDYLHQRGDGGWEWNSPLREWPVAHHHPDLVEMRRELTHCNDPGDFARLCGVGPTAPAADD